MGFSTILLQGHASITSVGDIYTRVMIGCQYLAMFAALIAGFRIFQRWNKGEDIESSLLNWFFGLLFVPFVIQAVSSQIVNKGWSDSESPDYTLGFVVADTASVIFALGIIVAVVGLIRIYSKFQNGDDDIPIFFLKWLGSLVFLSVMFGFVKIIK